MNFLFLLLLSSDDMNSGKSTKTIHDCISNKIFVHFLFCTPFGMLSIYYKPIIYVGGPGQGYSAGIALDMLSLIMFKGLGYLRSSDPTM